MDIRPIKTEAHHADAVAEIETLMGAEPGSEAFERLEALATVVDAYEAREHPIAAPDPVDALLFRLEQLGDPRIEVSDYINVSSKLEELDCSPPEGIGILPEQFDTCTSTGEFAQLSRTRAVMKLFEDNHIPFSVIKKEGQKLLGTRTASSGLSTWVGPTLFVSAALLAENPGIISLALNLLANSLTDFFKGAREENPSLEKSNKVRLHTVFEDRPGTYKKISYEGPLEGLKELNELIKQISDDK